MNVKEIVSLYQAQKEGKTILAKAKSEELKFEAAGFEIYTLEELLRHDFEIKPSPKLRPWKPEESIGKVVKFKNLKTDDLFLIVSANNDEAFFAQRKEIADMSYVNLLYDYLQLDGSPCGVEE